MIIGLDASGQFAATPLAEHFGSSAVAATTVPAAAASDIGAWTRERLASWGREELGELHAADLNWSQRHEVCEMLGKRADLHAAVIVTSNLLLRGPEAVSAHRGRQLELAKASHERATTSAGEERGARVCRLLAGHRLGSSRLADHEYVCAAMVPLAVMGAVQRAFCFYASDEWRSETVEFALSMDNETPATVRYVTESLLASIGGDDRFRPVTPKRWQEDPEHPLLTRARHPDGDGLWLQRIVGDTICWVSSHDHVAAQVADFAAWVVCRTINDPQEIRARECFELLRPLLAGEEGRCFELYSVGSVRPEDAVLYAHLHSAEQPEEWLTPPAQREAAIARTRPSTA